MSVWLITGASGGMGMALAEAVLLEGHSVLLTARSQAGVDRLQLVSQKYPERARVFQLDVTDNQACCDAVKDAIENFGQLDVLVNNAGRALVGALEEYSMEQIRESLETNFFGAVNMIRAALPSMRASRSGRIVNITGLVGLANEVGFSIYGAAKFALEGLSESLQSEVRHLGIKVIAVEPGPFRTGLLEHGLDRAQSSIDDYKQSSGKFADFLTKLSGTQSGDPQLAAALIVKAVAEERPPARLLLGPFAHKKVRDKIRRWTSEIDQWEALASATDFNLSDQ